MTWTQRGPARRICLVTLTGALTVGGLAACGKSATTSPPVPSTSAPISPSAGVTAPTPTASSSASVSTSPSSGSVAATATASALAASVSPSTSAIATPPTTPTPVVTATHVPSATVAYLAARHDWQVAADMAAAIQGQYWLEAAADLSGAVSAGDSNTTGFTAAAASLRQLAGLPDTDETKAQMTEAHEDVNVLNDFFQTANLYD